MTLPVYVITSGGVADYVFNAVAAYTQSHDFTILIGLAGLLGFVAAALRYQRERDIAIAAKWFGLFFLVTNILASPVLSQDVEIIDTTNPMATYNVANVPFGLAVPASLISEVMVGIAQGLDNVFHLPDDLNYSSTGMLYGDKIMESSLNPTPIPHALQQDVDSFYRQCILPDIEINQKYTFEQLAGTVNIFNWLSTQKMSLLRGIYFNGNFETCAQAVGSIQTAFQQFTSTQISNMQSQIAGPLGGTKTPSGQFANDLQTAYSYYLNGLSQDAASTVMQNSVINSIQQAGVDNASIYNNSAAQLINYSQTTGEQGFLMQTLTIAKVIANWLPFIQTAIFLAGVALFPIAILFTIDPTSSHRFFKNYLVFFVWICSWPVIFVAVNFISNVALSFTASNYTPGLTNPGITLSNINSVQFDFTVMYAISSLLTIAAVTGGLPGIMKMSNMGQALSSDLMGFARYSTGAAASALGDGNLSLGNMSAFNSNANKTDLNSSESYGMSAATNPNTGAMDKTWTSGGQSQFIGSDASGFVLGGNYAANFAQESSSQLQNMASQSKQAAMTLSEQASQGQSSDLQHLDQTMSQVTNDQSFQQMFSHDQSGQLMESYNTMQSNVQSYGQDHGWTNQQIGEVTKSLAFGANAKASLGKNLGPADGSIGGSVDLSRSAKNSEANQLTTDYKNSLTDTQTNELQNQQQSINSYMEQVQSLQSQGKQLSSGDQVLASLSKNNNEMRQANADYSQSMQYENMASSIKSSSVSYNQNMMPTFENWLKSNAYGASGQIKDPGYHEAYTALMDKETGRPVSSMANQSLSWAQNQFVSSQISGGGSAAQAQITSASSNVSSQASTWMSGVQSQGSAAVQSAASNGMAAARSDFSTQGGQQPSSRSFESNKNSVETNAGGQQSAIQNQGAALDQTKTADVENFDKNSGNISSNENRGVWATELNNDKKSVN